MTMAPETEVPDAAPGARNASAAPSRAWQPLTFGGVSMFARDSWMRLWVVQFLFSQLVAGAVFWAASFSYLPVAEQAIASVQGKGTVRNGRLEWENQEPRRLADSRVLSITLGDLPGRTPSDVELIFGMRAIRICSLGGCIRIPYSPGISYEWDRIELKAAFDAWKGIFGFAIWTGATLAILGSWHALGFLYGLPLTIAAWISGRQAGASGGWKMSMAALLAPSLLGTGAVVLYGLGLLDGVGFLFAILVHLVLQWVYLAGAWRRLPRRVVPAETPGAGNPFRRE